MGVQDEACGGWYYRTIQARLVCIEIVFDEVYAPVVRYDTILYLLVVAVKYNSDIDQMDARVR